VVEPGREKNSYGKFETFATTRLMKDLTHGPVCFIPKDRYREPVDTPTVITSMKKNLPFARSV
jgi:hypothetical protein